MRRLGLFVQNLWIKNLSVWIDFIYLEWYYKRKRVTCLVNVKGNTMTQEELANKIGVSRATLDRVMNNREGVGEKKRKQVLAAIKELGYKPNITGKMLSMQNRTSIGIIVGADKTPEDGRVFEIIYKSMLECSAQLEMSGVRFIYRHMVSGEVEEQIRIIDELVAEGVSGIAFAFREKTKELYDTIAKYQQKGIQFVPYFNTLFEPKSNLRFQCHLDTDQIREGRIAAGLLARFMSGKGKVVLISGLEENYVHQLRVDSAYELFKEKYPLIEVLPIYRNCYPESKAETLCQKILEETPDLKGIIVSCGFFGTITSCVEKMGKKDQISVILFDITKRAKEDLEKGRCEAIIGIDLKKLGYSTVKVIYELVFRNEVDEESWDIPLQILLKESIE